MLEVNQVYKTFNPGTVNEKQALRGDAIAHGNRLIMMYDGKSAKKDDCRTAAGLDKR